MNRNKTHRFAKNVSSKRSVALKQFVQFLLPLGLACSPIANAQSVKPYPVQMADSGQSAGFTNTLDARNFLPSDLMVGPHHRVLPRVETNGVSNTYIIETPHGNHTVQGTDQAKVRIFEIEATEFLREKTVIGAIGKATKDKTVNLVKTPIRIVGAVGDRIDAVESAQDALFFVPENVGLLIGKLANGVGEIGVTGARIVKGAGSTSCSGLNCVTDIGGDVWSGLNSIVGKHDAANRLHKSVGTNPETRNKALRRQVDRLAYTDAYTGTAYKMGLGVSNANIDYFSPVVTGTGYVNNGEFLTIYKDAYRERNANKERLNSWGISKDDIESLYSNENYTNAMRREINVHLQSFGTPNTRTRLVKIAKNASTPYVAHQNFLTIRYLAKEYGDGRIREIVPESGGAVGVRDNGTLVLPYVADYLQWTPSSERTVNYMSRLKTLSPDYRMSEIHVIGRASDEFKIKAQAMGVNIIETTQT